MRKRKDNVKEGDRVRVFDYRPWQKVGDVGDNSQFYFPATVARVYSVSKESLIDVVFDKEPDKVSKAHFLTGVQEL